MINEFKAIAKIATTTTTTTKKREEIMKMDTVL